MSGRLSGLSRSTNKRSDHGLVIWGISSQLYILMVEIVRVMRSNITYTHVLCVYLIDRHVRELVLLALVVRRVWSVQNHLTLVELKVWSS